MAHPDQVSGFSAQTMLAGLSEENVAPQDLPSGTAAETSAAGPSPSPTPGAAEDWQEVPAGSDSAPTNAASGNEASITVPAERAKSSEPAAAPSVQSGSAAESAPSASTVEPSAAASDSTPGPQDDGAPSDNAATPPPALDTSTIGSGPDLATASLDPEIKNAATPALAASLRLTEEARKELGDNDGIDGALRDLARAVSIDSDNPFAYFYLGRSYILRKNYGQALTFLRRAEIGFASRPDWLGETLSFEGVCNEELGHMPEAARAYQQALAAAPNNLMARVGYGRLSPVIAPPASMDAPPPAEPDVPGPPSDSVAVPAPSEPPPTDAKGGEPTD